MIDHVSIGVRELAACGRFYDAVLASIPDFWLNERRDMTPADPDSGTHICLRAPDAEAVHVFHAAAIKAGGVSDGDPGPRPEYAKGYYAAFVRDPEGNKIEVVTFITER